MLGYAATTDVKNVRLSSWTRTARPPAGSSSRRFDASPYFSVVATLPSIRDVDPWLERGTAWMALAIPADYHTGIDSGRPVTVQVIADGTDSNSAGVAMGYAANLVGAFNQDLGPRATGSRRARTCRPSAIDARNPRLVQPAAREPALHDPGHRRAAAAGDHDEPVVDGGGTREGVRHARAAQRHPGHRWQLIVGKLVPILGPLASSTSSW
jgi:ABC-2 type transport system permease protein